MVSDPIYEADPFSSWINNPKLTPLVVLWWINPSLAPLISFLIYQSFQRLIVALMKASPSGFGQQVCEASLSR